MIRRLGLGLALAGLLLVSHSPRAAAQQTIEINFSDVQLETFVKWVSEMTRTRFIYAPQIRTKKVYLLSPVKVSVSDVYKIFAAVMAHNGYALIDVGDTSDGWRSVRIIESANAKWQPATIVSAADIGKIKEYRYITLVIALKHVTARAANNALRIARISDPRAGQVVGLEDSNTLLVTGFAPNVRRIYEVIQLMDIAGEKPTIEVVKLQWATPDYLVPKLEKLLKAQSPRKAGEGASNTKEFANIVADNRANSIVLQAFPERIVELKRLIKQLDLQPVGESGGIHIYQLKHHNSEELEQVLTKLIQGGIPAQARPGAPQQAGGAASGAPEQTQVTVVADKANNSLVVTADPSQWKEIKAIITELDVRRPQVLIEAAVVEMSPSDALTVGVELGTTDTSNSGYRGFGATNFGLSQRVGSDGAPLSTDVINPGFPGRLPLAPVPSGVAFLSRTTGIRIGDTESSLFQIPIILQMLKSEIDLEILSMPRLLTNDNQQAMIKITEADPTIRQETTTSGSTVNSFDSFEEAGTVLEITPHISADNYLRLEVKLKLEVFQGTSAAPGLPRGKVSRELMTSITIPNKQTVVMGGLIRSQESTSVSKIPLLGDIPLLGFLFRRTDKSVQKTKLYLFVTPHILTDEKFADLAKISHDHKLEAHNNGANLQPVDPKFVEYQQRQNKGHGARGLPPMTNLRYRSPTDSNKGK